MSAATNDDGSTVCCNVCEATVACYDAVSAFDLQAPWKAGLALCLSCADECQAELNAWRMEAAQ